MSKNKLKMSNKRFLVIWIPILVVLTAFVIVANSLMSYYSPFLDNYLGKGKMNKQTLDGSEDWNTDYYETYTDDDFLTNLARSNSKAKEICDEGFILMKNNGVLPLAQNSTLSPFGFRYMHPTYSTYGSGAAVDGMGMAMMGGKVFDEDYLCTNELSVDVPTALKKNFTLNEATIIKMEKAQYERIDAAPGTTACQEMTMINGCAGSNTYLYEYNPSIYEGTENSCANTTGLVFIGRDNGEGGDKKHDAYLDGTPHELTLSSNEKGTIKFAKQHCKNVVAVINATNVMELGALVSGEYEVDAIIWIGFPGSNGAEALSDILCGKVNPSGRTVNIWVSNLLNDPTMANTGEFIYTSGEVAGSNATGSSFIEYEEGIYVGYKYYETAAVEDSSFSYDDAVVYPFGYGLSYTTFEQKITSFDDMGDKINITVEVKNTGKTDGKEVVQIYYNPPYTDYDKENKIEKAVKNLIAFDKVSVKAGGTKKVTLSFEKEDMASYSYTRDNGDGTKGCYILEAGDYEIYLGKNSHESWDTKTTTVRSTVYYDNSNPRQSEKDGQALLDDEGNPTDISAANGNFDFVAATNKFEDSNTYMTSSKVTLLSRADWTGTQPTAPDADDFVASKAVCDTIDAFSYDTFDYKTNPLLGNVSTSAVYKAEAPNEKQSNGLSLIDLRGKDYYDEEWDLLLDQIDYSDTDEIYALLKGAYSIEGLTSISMPKTYNGEGPCGFSLFAHLLYGDYMMNKTKFTGYASPVVLASTFNVQLAYDEGEAMGRDAKFFHLVKEGVDFSGVTGPSMNLVRNAFNGRNGEYYTEDPILAGQIGTHEVSGLADQGLYTVMKHFALNNQETAKVGYHGMSTWATEQTMRESYFKIYETVFKEARRTVKYISDENGTVSTKVIRGANAVMTSFNRVGAVPAGSNYAMNTLLLRNEWGFQGFVQTDMPNQSNPDQFLRSGGSIIMDNSGAYKAEDITSATAKWCIRRVVHDIAFTVVNSYGMQGIAPGTVITYSTSPWRICLTVADVVLGVFIAGMAVYCVVRTVDSGKHPEKYKSKEKI